MAYGGPAAELFDDGIEPAAVGYLADDAPRADAERVLGERIEASDAVIRARIVTVTSRESDRAWLMGIEPLETLSGQAPQGEVVFQIDAHDRAAGLVRAGEARLVGKTVVLFLRAFAPGADPRKVHFHIAPDTAAAVAAVRSAALLRDVHGN